MNALAVTHRKDFRAPSDLTRAAPRWPRPLGRRSNAATLLAPCMGTDFAMSGGHGSPRGGIRAKATHRDGALQHRTAALRVLPAARGGVV